MSTRRDFDALLARPTVDIPRDGSITVHWKSHDATPTTPATPAYTKVAVTLPDGTIDLSREWHADIDDGDDDHVVLAAVVGLIDDALRNRLAITNPAEKAVRYGTRRR